MLHPRKIKYDTPGEYREHYVKFYCKQRVITFDGITVFFRANKFDHAFYESSERDGKKDVFSIVRAERIDWIRATLENPKSELYLGWDKQKKIYDNSRRVSVVYENFVVVIWISKLDEMGKPLTAEFVTAYDADNSIEKIRCSPVWRP